MRDWLVIVCVRKELRQKEGKSVKLNQRRGRDHVAKSAYMKK